MKTSFKLREGRLVLALLVCLAGFALEVVGLTQGADAPLKLGFVIELAAMSYAPISALLKKR